MKKNTPEDQKSINLINEGTRITGEMVSSGDVRVDGFFKGEISTNARLALGTTGELNGHIACANADVAGKILGELVVKEVLTLRSTAVVEGDIKVGKLIVEEGANFTGNCEMIGAKRAQSEASVLAKAESA